ncbi:hypothetical protein ALMP_72790 [Streptomyces sp. A012304]|nr:hypothetical protein ALMP_72790 [Streptomyces sp. A012304]
MWHLTMTGATPAPVFKTLLSGLAEEYAWGTAIGSPTTEKTVIAATRPLTDAGWKHTVDGRWIRWETLQGDAGVQFDAFAAQRPHSTLATWTLWAGPSIDRPTWAITASLYTPAALLVDLTENLAQGTGIRTHTPVAKCAGRGGPRPRALRYRRVRASRRRLRWPRRCRFPWRCRGRRRRGPPRR